MSSHGSENFDDEARDDAYFTLLDELESKNISRYEEQARQLIQRKFLILQIDNLWVKYSLDRFGCSCDVSYDSGNSYIEHSWSRLGWGRKKKEKWLPAYFAQTEADVKFGLGN
jgi:hypothetical protein